MIFCKDLEQFTPLSLWERVKAFRSLGEEGGLKLYNISNIEYVMQQQMMKQLINNVKPLNRCTGFNLKHFLNIISTAMFSAINVTKLYTGENNLKNLNMLHKSSIT